MNLENQLRESLQEKGNELIPSSELKIRVMSSITGKRKPKKRLMAGIIVAALLLPTGVYASQSFLADDFYGSFENLKKHISNATMEGYFLLSAKLSQANGELGEEDYKEFKEQLNVITDAKINYGNQNGNIDYDRLPAEKMDEIKQTLMLIQPYFDKLNGQKISKEVLTPVEYITYIEALMTYEKVMAQSGINPSEGPIEMEMLPSHLQSEFIEADDFLKYVDEKQVQ